MSRRVFAGTHFARMSTRAAKIAQAKAAAVAARKRKADQLNKERLEFMARFDATIKAIDNRHARDDATKKKVIQGDNSWRKKGKAISGSEEGLYPEDAIEKDDCVEKARAKLAAWLATKPSFTGFVPYVPNGKLVWKKMCQKLERQGVLGGRRRRMSGAVCRDVRFLCSVLLRGGI